jgi:hypothetical protein
MENDKWKILSFRFRNLPIFFLLVFPLLNGCRSALRPVETGAPGPAVSVYPLLLPEDAARRERSLNVWTNVARGQGIVDPPEPVLHPVTSTIIGLPKFTKQYLLLPKVGEATPMTEEETREALRRFMREGGAFLCGYSQQFSLIARIDEADGTKRAIYQQQIFRYPLRGEFGRVEITFLASRRIVGLNSACLPNTDSLQRAVAELRPNPSVTPESIIVTLKGQTLAVKKDNGNTESLLINEGDEINVQELVVYSRTADANNASIALYLAWEVKIANKATIYFDSRNGELLAATAIASQSSFSQPPLRDSGEVLLRRARLDISQVARRLVTKAL